MDLLVAYREDPAGFNMASYISEDMSKEDEVFRGKYFDLAVIDSPAISADWLEDKYHYDGFVFLSKHAAESGVLALTCHSTGNFADAPFGGNPRQLAIPYPSLQKDYLKKLYDNKNAFLDFQITIEATHHGPTALNKPCLFIEIGTTPQQWNNKQLCKNVAEIVVDVMKNKRNCYPFAICFGGTHYPEKFTKELIEGKFALGTVMPKHSLDNLDEELFYHIMERNQYVSAAILDWGGLGKNKQKIIEHLEKTDLEIIKV